MFKIDDMVVVKEVHKKYGRTSSMIEKLENIAEQRLVGKVITTDVSDSMLNVYVSFEGAEENLWFNNEELSKSYSTLKLLPTPLVKALEELEVDDEEIDDEMKVELFNVAIEELMRAKNLEDKSVLYDVLKIDYIVKCYTDVLMDEVEFAKENNEEDIKRIVRFLLEEFSRDFDLSVEDMIKKFK